jgi:dihydrofolate reductase
LANLIYIINASLDGYIEDSQGRFDWGEPDEEVHQFFNDLLRPAGTQLYGRRMYETMMVWETDPDLVNENAITRDFAQVWQAAEKVVYSRTLATVSTQKTRLERTFDPDPVQKMKRSADRDLFIGGPELASHAFRLGLIEEVQLMLAPVIVGSGKTALPRDLRLQLELLDERRFGNGTVYLRYRVG